MTSRQANLLTAAGLLALLFGVSTSAPRWAPLLARSLSSPGDEAGSEPGGGGHAEAEAAAAVERQIKVKLFFQAADRPGLVIEEREVAQAPELSRQVRTVVEELARGSRIGLQPTLSPGTKVLEVFVTARGVAYVDLSKEVAQEHPGGAEAELITIYSVVNSLTANFPAVKKVQILVDDRPAPTLAGHVDLTRPLAPDLTFMASAGLTPAAPTP
jgi:spore germination protein GerM